MKKKLQEQGLKRTVLNVSLDIHTQIKSYATFRQESMRAYIVRALLEQFKKDEEYMR
jgi:hypothetical protein